MPDYWISHPDSMGMSDESAISISTRVGPIGDT